MNPGALFNQVVTPTEEEAKVLKKLRTPTGLRVEGKPARTAAEKEERAKRKKRRQTAKAARKRNRR